MLLSYNRLVQLIAEGVIEGADVRHVNSASIDITLGEEILMEDGFEAKDRGATGRPLIYPPVEVGKKQSLAMAKHTMDPETGYDLYPGEFILAHSKEIFNLPNYISAEYKLKSSMARCGLEHMNAGWCDAGWHGSVLTLEFVNLSRWHVLKLRPGDKIGQVVFFEHEAVESQYSYAARGRYNNKPSVVGAIAD